MQRQELIDAVIQQLKSDIESNDVTVLNELLHEVDTMTLIQSLPESEHEKYIKELL